MTKDSDVGERGLRERIPSLFELFFGKLANWSRDRLRRRREGRLGKARMIVRKSARLEALEPRLLLSADAYGIATDGLLVDPEGNLPGNNNELRLEIHSDAGTPTARLYHDGTQVLSRALNDPAGARFDITGGLGNDTLIVALNFVTPTGGYAGIPLEINFDGGFDPLGVSFDDDNVIVHGSSDAGDVGYEALGLSVNSTDDIFVETDTTVFGDLSLTSESAVDVSDVALTAQDASGSGFSDINLLAQTGMADTLLDLDVFADEAAAVNISNSSLTGDDVVVSAATALDLQPSAIPLIGVATVVASTDAVVAITDSVVTATGNFSVSAMSDVTARAVTQSDSAGIDTGIDAAGALVWVDSTASATVGGASTVTVGGAMSINVGNQVDAEARADGSGGGAGGVVAVTTLLGDTAAAIDGAVSGTADSISVVAMSERSAITEARATPDGATASGDGSNESEQRLADPNADGDTSDHASTSDGSINLAGAVAVTTSSYDTSASVTLAHTIGQRLTGSNGMLIQASSQTNAETTADGTATSDGSGDGAGVAVAINTGVIGSNAFLAGVGNLAAGGDGITIEALMPASSFTASATSGAKSSSGVGFAGSLAINVLTTDTVAEIRSGSIFDLANASVHLNARSDTTMSASARPVPDSVHQSHSQLPTTKPSLRCAMALDCTVLVTCHWMPNRTTPLPAMPPVARPAEPLSRQWWR